LREDAYWGRDLSEVCCHVGWLGVVG
jgi:hypothetical protein